MDPTPPTASALRSAEAARAVWRMCMCWRRSTISV